MFDEVFMQDTPGDPPPRSPPSRRGLNSRDGAIGRQLGVLLSDVWEQGLPSELEAQLAELESAEAERGNVRGRDEEIV